MKILHKIADAARKVIARQKPTMLTSDLRSAMAEYEKFKEALP